MLRRFMLPIGLLLSLATPALYVSAAAQPAGSTAASCKASFYQGGRPPAATGTAAPQGRLICQSFYAVSYSTTLRDPVWTSYQLTKEMADGGTSIERYEGDFIQQPGLDEEEQGSHDDFTRQGFERGHLTPADDAINMDRQRDTFFVTNIVPQIGSFNRQDWARLEASVHRVAQLEGRVFVVTGATFPANPTRIPRGANGRIAVPDHMYKAIFIPTRNIAIAYYASNEQPTRCRIMSITELTQTVGVDPFPALPDSTKATRPDFTLPRGRRRNGTQVALPRCQVGL